MKDLAPPLERLRNEGLHRTLKEGGSGTEIERDGRRLVNLASNDSLGLSTDPSVVAALHEGAMRFGAGASASRLVSGNHAVHGELEEAIADTRGTEAALVFSSGYAANVGVLSALVGRHDVVFADTLVHASLLDGIRLSGARLVRHRHLDLEHLEDLLKTTDHSGQRFIVTEGVFSMDGDLADLPGLVDIAATHDAMLIVDDAHGGGVVGDQGRGSMLGFPVPVQLGTLSKAVGAQGGYVAGDLALIDYLVNHARSFIFSTGLSPALSAAALEGLRRARDADQARANLRHHVDVVRECLAAAGFEVLGDPRAPMVPAIVPDPNEALRMSNLLAVHGVLAPAIRPPAVPVSRLRFSPMATHTSEQIQRACTAIREVAR